MIGEEVLGLIPFVISDTTGSNGLVVQYTHDAGSAYQVFLSYGVNDVYGVVAEEYPNGKIEISFSVNCITEEFDKSYDYEIFFNNVQIYPTESASDNVKELALQYIVKAEMWSRYFVDHLLPKQPVY